MNSNGELKTVSNPAEVSKRYITNKINVVLTREDLKSEEVSKVKIPTLDNLKLNGKFADLAAETLEKIKRNPFWNEYTKDSKQKMISKYFDNKIKRKEYNTTEYSLNDKLTFIDKVLKSVV